jgi:membrane-bound metal-dependent hydrolase YbcI (DUF457 family)
MDPLTHALASYALKRAAFPRVARPLTIAIVLAGTLANIDALSAYLGPSAFFHTYRTYCHSLLAAFLIALFLTLSFLPINRRSPENQLALRTVFFATLSAALLHLLMDLCQTEGLELLWPFSARRFALDWVAHLDLWILALLLFGILMPNLAGLVTEEIGAKSKAPRGRIGAVLSLAAILLYLVLRFTLHGNAIASLESRSYRGESPKKAAALADSSSPFKWDGVIETERALHSLSLTLGPASAFDPESAVTSYKPESSPALDAALETDTARQFLQAARFPKASVEQVPTGFRVTLRAFPYDADSRSGWRVEAVIDTDASGKILAQQFLWDPASRQVWWR